MTKFQEMCGALDEGIRLWSEYRDHSYKNLSLFVNGFVDYCGIPRDHVSYRPLNKEPKPKTKYALVGATHLDPDGFWHLGLVIDLRHDPEGSFSFGINRILFEICMKEENGSLLFRSGKSGKVEPLDLANKQLFNEYYDRLVELAKARLLNALRDFLNGTAPRQFGFVTA